MKKLFFSLCLLLASYASANAADSWTTYTNSTYKPMSSLLYTTIAVDSTNKLWYTDDANHNICSFDGTNWKFEYQYGPTYSIYVTPQNVKWFGTEGYLTKYDGSTWTDYELSSLISGYPPSASSPNIIKIIEDKSGNLWLATSGAGLVKYTGSTWSRYTKANAGLTNDSISCMTMDKAGNIWIGYSNKYTGYFKRGHGVSKFDGTTWTHYTSFPNNAVHGIVQDPDGNMWFGTHGGLVKYNGSTFTSCLKDTTSESYNFAHDLNIDKTGNLFFCSEFGVVRYNRAGKWTYWDDSNLGTNFIYVDKNNKVWFSDFTDDAFKVLMQTTTDLASVKTEPLAVYPSPTADVLQLSTGTAGQLSISNLSGIEVLQQEVAANASISLAALPNAVYIVKWTDGKKQQVAKLVKK